MKVNVMSDLKGILKTACFKSAREENGLIGMNGEDITGIPNGMPKN